MINDGKNLLLLFSFPYWIIIKENLRVKSILLIENILWQKEFDTV